MNNRIKPFFVFLVDTLSFCMHSFSCFFLLHHHFEALTTSPDSISISSSIINDDTMSDESDIEGEQSNIDTSVQIPQDEIIEPQSDDSRRDSAINPVDEDSQFIYDDETNKLICIGTNFDNIPQSIIDAYSLQTKVKKII